MWEIRELGDAGVVLINEEESEGEAYMQRESRERAEREQRESRETGWERVASGLFYLAILRLLKHCETYTMSRIHLLDLDTFHLLLSRKLQPDPLGKRAQEAC